MRTFLRIVTIAFLAISTHQAQAQNYCEYLFGFAWCSTGWEVDDITVGTFSQLNSGCNSGPYNNNTTSTISLTKGGNVPFTLGSNGSVYWGIWVDCNSDGDFTDATDYFWASSGPSFTVSGNILIPSSATGTTTRIRIRSDAASVMVKADACIWPFNSETQDFVAVLNSGSGCNVPTNLAALPSTTSAVLSWDSVGTLYNIEYGAASFVPGTGTSLNALTNSATISNLIANTSYDFYVRNACAGNTFSSWNGPFTFTTECTAVATFPYLETFNGSAWVPNGLYQYFDDTISNCYDRYPLFNYNFAWLLRTGQTPTTNTGPDNAFGGSGAYMHIEQGGSIGDEATFTSPLFNTNSLTSPYLQFYYHMYGIDMGNLYIDVSANGGQTWVTVDSLVGEQQTSGTAAWLPRGVNVTAYKGPSFRFRFRGKNTTGWASLGDMAVDQITISEAPLCPIPSNLNFASITGNTALLNWNSTATEHYVEIGLAGFTQGQGMFDTATTNTYAFTGLSGATDYDVYIMAGCGSNGNSLWAGPYSFRTILTPDWEEDFDVNGFLPNLRWGQASGVIGNPTTFTSTYSNWYETGWLNVGSSGAVVGNISTWGTREEWFFTEKVDLGTNNTYELYFDAALTTAYASSSGLLQADDTLRVVISTDAGLTWHKANTIFTLSQANNLTNSGQTFTVPLTGYNGIVKFGFYLESTVTNITGVDLFVDKIGVRVPSACPSPTAINANNITANSVTLGWTSASNSFFIEYGPENFSQGTGTIVSAISTNSATISGLSPVTVYDFYVHSVCGSDTSNGGKITVLTGCPAIFTTPYFQNFDYLTEAPPPATGDWPICWHSNNSTGYKFRWEAGDGVSNWSNTGPAADHTTGIAEDGTYMFTESGSGLEATLSAGPFDLAGLTSPMLSFWYHMFGADMGEMHIDISKNNVNWDEDIYVLVGEQQSSSTANWKRAKLALSQYINDTIYIRFRGTNGGYNGQMAIDDVALTNASGCIKPSGLMAEALTTTSVKLEWGSYASNHTIEWGPKGFTQGTGQGTVVTNIIGSTHTLTGLTAATAYDYYVQDTCTNANWIGPKTFFTDCTGPLAGAYTIGGTPGSTNFVNISAAIDALSNCGISGPVTFNLQGISDTGRYEFKNNITGLNAANTVSFIGNGNDSIYAKNQSNYVFSFDGAAFITLKNLSIFGGFSNTCIWLHNQAHDITIENCKIYGQGGSSPSYSSASIMASASPSNSNDGGQNAFNISILDNTFYEGYRSISMYGETNFNTHGLTISNNTFVNPNYSALRVSSMDSVTISGNHLNGVTSPWSGEGFALTAVNEFTITGNYININGGALNINQGNEDTVSHNSSIINNMFITTNQYSNGINLSNVNHVNIYHNSVSSYGDAAYISAWAGGNYFNIRNNIFASSSGLALYRNTSGSSFLFNHNIYYSAGIDLVFDNTSYTSLTAWKTAVPAQNANSIQADPGFLSATDLHIISAVPNDVGDNTLGISVDFDGDSRPIGTSTTVDIGADEYTPKNHDMSVQSFFMPQSGCGDSATSVMAIIKNFGLTAVTSVPVTAIVSGDVTATLTATYTGNLLQLATDTVLLGTINTYAGASNITISTYTSLANDEDVTNDTIVAGPLFFIAVEPKILAPDSVCNDPTATVTLRAQPYPGVTYGWYANSTDTVPTALGDSISYTLGQQNGWYLGYIDGMVDSLISDNYNAIYGGFGGLMFNLTAKTSIEIDSLNLHTRVNQGDTSSVVIYYIPNADYDDYKTLSSSWIVHDTILIVGAGNGLATKAVLNSPLFIPTGATYAMYFEFNAFWEEKNALNNIANSTMMTYQSGIGLFNGPFSGIENDRVLEGSIFAHNVACATSRTFVSQSIYTDTAQASFSTIVSQPNKVDVDAGASQGHLVEWNFGDGATASGAIASHIYTNGGAYTITCIVTDTVCNTVDTAYFSVQMTIGVDENALANAIAIYPNPSTGMFNLRFATEATAASLTIVDGLSRVIKHVDLENIEANGTTSFDLSSEPNGLYFVKIEIDGAVAVKKITKM